MDPTQPIMKERAAKWLLEARCYQQPDDATMLTVVLGGVELRDKKA